MHELFKILFDNLFGNLIIKRIIISTVGYRFNGWFLGLVGYRAIHMVSSGESCIIAGVYSEHTIRDFSKVIGDNGTVVVVEANPQNASRLIDDCNDLKNVVITNKAIWRESGEMEFILSKQSREQGYNRLVSDELQHFPEHLDDNPIIIKVPTDTLVNISNEFGIKKLDHVNLTINGAELQAVECMAELLHQHPNVRIYINSETPDPAERTIECLEQIGFKVSLSTLIRTVNKKIKLVRIYCTS
jgi:FkbM family methyltransferase